MMAKCEISLDKLVEFADRIKDKQQELDRTNKDFKIFRENARQETKKSNDRKSKLEKQLWEKQETSIYYIEGYKEIVKLGKELESKLDTAISALKHLRTMDTWQNVKQINDFLDETLKEVE